VHELLAAPVDGRSPRLLHIDAKALPVGTFSRDPDARSGRMGPRFARGYKLHVVVSDDRKIRLFTLVPLNVAEQTVAMEMIPAPPLAGAGPRCPGAGRCQL